MGNFMFWLGKDGADPALVASDGAASVSTKGFDPGECAKNELNLQYRILQHARGRLNADLCRVRGDMDRVLSQWMRWGGKPHG